MLKGLPTGAIIVQRTNEGVHYVHGEQLHFRTYADIRLARLLAIEPTPTEDAPAPSRKRAPRDERPLRPITTGFRYGCDGSGGWWLRPARKLTDAPVAHGNEQTYTRRVDTLGVDTSLATGDA